MQGVLAGAGRWIDRIKINELVRVTRDSRAYWVKRRRPWAGFVIRIANGFFRIVGNRVIILGDDAAWHAWERNCSTILYGSQDLPEVDATGRLWSPEFAGRSLSSHIDDGTADASQFAAAARELRRAHALDCPALAGKWSHGDPHSGNFIYDPASDTAKLMDFEVRHDKTVPEDLRHADDLLVFLQDTLGRLSRERWIVLAEVFVREYGQPAVAAQLMKRLIEPRGPAKLWWAVRTTYLAPQEISARLAALRAALATT